MSVKLPEWERATEAIQNAESVLIVTHISPDGDAMGSALGLANALLAMGKQVTVADDDGVPDYLEFVPGSDRVVKQLDDGSWDVMISTDASDEVRTGEVGKYGRTHSRTVINLDHHATNTYFGDIYLVVPEAVSATEIVFDWWEHIGINWQPEIAVPLLTGLVTDTRGFRTSAVTARTLGIAQSLMERGASLTEITARTLDSKSYKEVEVWKQALPSVQLHGEVIVASLRQSDMFAAGLDEMTDAGLVSFLNTVDEARIAVVFKEEAPQEIKLSLRAKPGYDVASVAYQLGGGGHKQAAGATLYLSLEEARAKVLPLLQIAAKEGELNIV
jgi:phosphoesterase RecJ-like protein